MSSDPHTFAYIPLLFWRIGIVGILMLLEQSTRMLSPCLYLAQAHFFAVYSATLILHC